MKSLQVKPTCSHLKGEITLPGDKSIAHRSIILSAISVGETIIENFPTSKDCIYTVKAFKKLGINIKGSSTIRVLGRGLYGLKRPQGPIFVGNSGTTLRIILGVLAGQDFKVRLMPGRSLSRRPMRRVTLPLRLMGARIDSRLKIKDSKIEEYPPITINAGNLRPIAYKMPIASAQVKSAILLAGLYAKGKTTVIEQIKSRDHTERMLKLFRADIKLKQNTIVIKGNKKLVSPKRIYLPGDISSGSFFIVLATLLADSKIQIRNISLNPSRIGIIRVLKRMGANIKIQNPKTKVQNYEPMGDLRVKSSRLKGTRVEKEEVPSLIDELPILMVAACKAKGRTILEGLSELRVKETDRIKSLSKNLKRMGAIIKVVKGSDSEKIIVQGVKELKGCRVMTFGDHRTAMSMVIAALVARGRTHIDDVSCINKSFPGFLSILKTLIYKD